jgi:putative protease
LLVDGRHQPLGDARYLLSPGDLYALPLLPRILPLGISSLKIEGRYKDADYVALTTAAYRKAVDEAYAGLPLSISAAEHTQLEQVYSRGLGPYFVQGVNHQQVVDGRAPRHRGVYMGTVTRIEPANGVIVIRPGQAHAISPLKPGDGLVFDAADWRSPDEREEGGRIYQVGARKDGLLALGFANNALDFARIRPGDRIWRSDDPDIARLAKPYTQPGAPVRKQPVNMKLVAREGERLQLTLWLHRQPDVSVSVAGGEPVARASRQPLGETAAREQLSRLGDTPYQLNTLTCELDGQPFVPASALNALRRDAIAMLAALQKQPSARVVEPGSHKLDQALNTLNALTKRDSTAAGAAGRAQLHVLVRTPEQLDATLALTTAPDSITLDYLELYGLRPAVERIEASGIRARVASPRVLKPDEERVVNFLRKLGCDILVRSSGLLHTLTQEGGPEDCALIGDFSLNTANVLTAAAYLEMNLQRITPTYDLNAAQIATLARRVGGIALEVIAYAHLPVFHTEHCVFCRFLSNGSSYKDCGHPCEKHRIALRDHNGRAHPVLADVGCRNTVFGAEAQEISAHLEALREAGVAHFRIEFVHENAEQTRRVIEAFQHALAGSLDAPALGARLRMIAPQGVTEGSLRVPLAG